VITALQSQLYADSFSNPHRREAVASGATPQGSQHDRLLVNPQSTGRGHCPYRQGYYGLRSTGSTRWTGILRTTLRTRRPVRTRRPIRTRNDSHVCLPMRRNIQDATHAQAQRFLASFNAAKSVGSSSPASPQRRTTGISARDLTIPFRTRRCLSDGKSR